ncbi:lipopolysaccharide biosynthesis protein [Salegentibacter mishustinae]|uniref:Polysaccharide biosynthesis protein n=1 Tax=Salegentibacter mishustinae TaxID=270918 RepID=A0A0Q9ZC59_9FLAO|nr:MATE family efflux transporter [Salegentibacter mishustinae]KRG30652.1 hypothetical protein APR42_01950 [Salegentibacter mishustinae]PNW23540.1 hypothetical protein APB85_01945 [Salegentibacter mishustinae]PZX66618.1 O-antigen/teichoic acid export membrane protein [Salegentibacter mishustinae]GGW83530.1 hypothetical protein GCM10008086_09780 [Salegentibacter mishustinae]
MGGLLIRFREFVNRGGDRTSLAKKNIISSFGLKFFDIVLEFLLVPLSLTYLTQASYGIWLTIFSLINWFNFFDLGMSHGYRNKLTVALSENDLESAKKYTSTIYFTIGFISLSTLFIGLIIVPEINWQAILNTDDVSEDILASLMILLTIYFALNLTSKIISSVFLAKQMPFLSNIINTLTKLFILIGLSALVIFYGEENLIFYAGIFLICPLIILITISIYFFSGRYKNFKPTWKYFDKEIIRDLLGLGGKFFIIQIGVTMLFMSDNLIISHLLGPKEVTPYQITQKYFGIPLLLFTIVMTPFWSAITEAYAKKDFSWISNLIKKLNLGWLGICVMILIMLFVFYPFLNFWVGENIEVPFFLALQWAIFVLLQTHNQIYTYFLNGTGKLNLQMWTNIFTLALNIPLSIFFAKNLGFGSAGVIMATNISILLYLILRKIQYNKIINGKATGIWES